MKTNNTAAVLAVLLSALCAASAAENMMLDEIVVRGRKEAPNQESLSVREVRESPARDMGEALKQVEGVNIVRKGAIANDVVLRGFQRDNINVLVDGLRLNGACPNRMDSPAFHYDFAEIERVEIIKGPYDLSNPGSMGGMINAVTKKPHPGLGSDLSASYGSYHSFNGSATGSYGTDRYDVLGGAAYKYSKVPRSGDGSLITDIYPGSSANRYRLDKLSSTAYAIDTYWGQAGFNPTSKSRTDLSYSYQDARHVLYPYLLMDAKSDVTDIVDWNYKVADVSPLVKNLKFQIYWDHVSHIMDDSYRESSRPSAMVTRSYSMRSSAKTETAGGKAQGELDLGGGTLRGGADLYSRGWKVINMRAMAASYAPLNMIPDATIVNTGAFAEYEKPLSGRMTLAGGLRADFARAYNNTDNQVAPSATKRIFRTGSGDVRLTARPAEGLEVFTGLAQGSRLPDQKELYISIPAIAGSLKDTSGNTALKATTNDEADLGAKYSTDKFYVNASIFYSALDNYINLAGFTANGIKYLTYENVDAAMWGGEAGSQVSLPYDLFLKGGLSYTWAKNTTGDRPLSEIPPFKGTAAVRYDDGAWFAEATENMTMRQSRVDPVLQEEKTAGWATSDLKAGYTHKDLSVYAGVYNLFNKQYFTYLSYLRDPFSSGMKVPENGRNFYITCTYRI